MKYAAIIFLILILAGCGAEPSNSKAQELAEELRQQAEANESGESTQEITVTPEPATEAELQPEPTIEPEDEPETQPEPEPATTYEEKGMEAITGETTYEEPEVEEKHKRTIMHDFLDTFVNEVTGYQFFYKRDKYKVRGNKIKIKLAEPVTIRGLVINGTRYNIFYYDAIYLDREKETATAYCEGLLPKTSSQCEQLELKDAAYDVEFSEYSVLLPEDWLFNNLDEKPKKISKDRYYISGRKVVRFEIGTTEYNFDGRTGLPLRVDRREQGVLHRYDYEELSANTVRKVDVIHRSEDEIPSEEVFSSRID